jgi:signal peptidase I
MNENSPQINVNNLPETTPKWHQKTWFRDILSFVAIVVLIIIPFRMFVAQPYLVDGSSMDPTFKNGEYLIVDELSYRFENPQRGDVIIFRYPLDPSQFFIKRVIGLPGETVKLTPTGTYIINTDHPDGMKVSEPYVVFNKTDTLTYTLKSGQYFAMGDNRPASADSRLWGPVPRANIVGRPVIALFPLDKVSLMPGSVSAFTNK